VALQGPSLECAACAELCGAGLGVGLLGGAWERCSRPPPTSHRPLRHRWARVEAWACPRTASDTGGAQSLEGATRGERRGGQDWPEEGLAGRTWG
jgi:hypothetical protein